MECYMPLYAKDTDSTAEEGTCIAARLQEKGRVWSSNGRCSWEGGSEEEEFRRYSGPLDDPGPDL